MNFLFVWIGIFGLVCYVRRLDWCVSGRCTFFVCSACGVQCAYKSCLSYILHILANITPINTIFIFSSCFTTCCKATFTFSLPSSPRPPPFAVQNSVVLPVFLIHLFITTQFLKYIQPNRTQCSSSGETNCFNTASGNSHSVLLAEMCAGWKKTSSNLHTSRPPT